MIACFFCSSLRKSATLVYISIMEQSGNLEVISPLNTKEKEAQETRIQNIGKQLEKLQVSDTITDFEEVLAAGRDVNKLSSLYDAATSRTKAILGGVLFATAFLGGSSSITETPATKIESDQTFEFLQGMKKDLVNMTGLDILKISNDAGRFVTYTKPTETTALTIVHIGQTHKTTSENNFMFKDEIVQSQKEVAQILSAITMPSVKVFTEGYTETSMSFVEEDKSIVKKLTAPTSFEDLKREYTNIWENHLFVDKALLNKVMGDKLISLGFTETSPLGFTKGDQLLVLYPTGLLPEDKAYTEKNENQSIMAGATQLLNFKDAITLVPAETREGNAKAGILRSQLKAKGEQFGVFLNSYAKQSTTMQASSQKPPMDISFYNSESIRSMSTSPECKKNNECTRLAKEIIEQDLPAIERAVMDDREDIAVELMAKAAKEGQKVFPLVYGSAHDFNRAVDKWNMSHPEMRFNLVSIKK
jgi:hypothetical protein